MLCIATYSVDNKQFEKVLEIDLRYGVDQYRLKHLVADIPLVPYGSNMSVEIKLWEAIAKDDKLAKGKYVGGCSVQLEEQSMGVDDYDKKCKELCDDLSENLANYLIYYSYEQGHSCGFEECVNILQDLAYGVKEALRKDGLVK